MRKFCIFCGEKPVSKNKEHILPKWLIKLTGNPNRIVRIGKKDGKEIQFSWMNYSFPSCEGCNSNYAAIEGRVKTVVEKLLDSQRVTHKEFDLFLDWLDKIRIGIWLGQAQLYKKEVNPNFYINQRVGEKDRLCIIYKTFDNETGIGITGTEVPLFTSIPSCFGLSINHLVIFNYSREFLLAKNMGFPYPEKYHYHTNGMIRIDNLKIGTNNFVMPFLKGNVIKPSIKFYQVIIKGQHGLKKPRIGKASKFLNNYSLKFSSDLIKSRIYVSDEFKNYNQFWEKGKKLKFEIAKEYKRDVLMLSLAKLIFEHQIDSAMDAFEHLEEFDEIEKEDFIDYYRELIEKNKFQISLLDEVLNPILKRK